MRTTEFISPRGNILVIHDPLEPGTPEWDARQKRWERAVAEFGRKELQRRARCGEL